MNRQPAILTYVSQPPECHEYDPAGADVARRVSLWILARLPMVAVEHVGSTAVAGCAGKGIVDLVLVYPNGRLELAKSILATLGFQPQSSGHIFPESRPMRVGAVEHEGRIYRLHVHVVAEGSAEVSQMCGFRDRLRADPALMASYVERKRAIIASGVTNPADYTRMKSVFIQHVLADTPDVGASTAPEARLPRRRGRARHR